MEPVGMDDMPPPWDDDVWQASAFASAPHLHRFRVLWHEIFSKIQSLSLWRRWLYPAVQLTPVANV
jgi:hypothetical protein